MAPPRAFRKGKALPDDDSDVEVNDDDDDDEMPAAGGVEGVPYRGGDENEDDIAADEVGAFKAEKMKRRDLARRRGGESKTDDVKEGEGVDEDQTIDVDDGIRIEPFNMRLEKEQGIMKDGEIMVGEWGSAMKEEAYTDGWLDTVDAGDSSAIIQNEELKQKVKDRMAMLDFDVEKMDKVDMVPVLQELIDFCKPFEQVSRALSRQRPPPRDKKRKKGDTGTPEEAKFERFSELCNMAMTQGYHDIYSATREQLKEWRRHKENPETSQMMMPKGPYWQYRWVKGDQKGEVFGPFPNMMMTVWAAGGCFSAENPAEVRNCTADGIILEDNWVAWDAIDFAKFQDSPTSIAVSAPKEKRPSAAVVEPDAKKAKTEAEAAQVEQPAAERVDELD
mmetsp:Transcript_96847/g.221788  ORF Transcript_96847/g.221788 Transcript_96847/m.221788 type:complete len:391 (-) Transcript_96847:19-1191(-)